MRIDREEIYDILDQMRATIPEEIKQARWIVKERQEMLAEAKRECDRILGEAREQAAREASQTEIVKLAERQAQEIIDDARRQARETRLEMEDWADGILSTLEVNLDKFLQRRQARSRAAARALAGERRRRRRGERRRRSRVLSWPAAATAKPPPRTSGLRCFGRRADARRQLLRQLDERLRRPGAAPVAVPGDADQARRHAVAEIDDVNRGVGLVDGQARHDATPTPAATRPWTVPLSSERKAMCGSRPARRSRSSTRCVGAAGAVRDQRLVEQLAEASAAGRATASGEPAGTTST